MEKKSVLILAGGGFVVCLVILCVVVLLVWLINREDDSTDTDTSTSSKSTLSSTSTSTATLKSLGKFKLTESSVDTIKIEPYYVNNNDKPVSMIATDDVNISITSSSSGSLIPILGNPFKWSSLYPNGLSIPVTLDMNTIYNVTISAVNASPVVLQFSPITNKTLGSFNIGSITSNSFKIILNNDDEYMLNNDTITYTFKNTITNQVISITNFPTTFGKLENFIAVIPSGTTFSDVNIYSLEISHSSNGRTIKMNKNFTYRSTRSLGTFSLSDKYTNGVTLTKPTDFIGMLPSDSISIVIENDLRTAIIPTTTMPTRWDGLPSVLRIPVDLTNTNMDYKVRVTYSSSANDALEWSETFKSSVRTMGVFDVIDASTNSFTINLGTSSGMKTTDTVRVSCRDVATGTDIPLTGTNPVSWGSLNGMRYTGVFVSGSSYTVTITYEGDSSIPPINNSISFTFTPGRIRVGSFTVTENSGGINFTNGFRINLTPGTSLGINTNDTFYVRLSTTAGVSGIPISKVGASSSYSQNTQISWGELNNSSYVTQNFLQGDNTYEVEIESTTSRSLRASSFFVAVLYKSMGEFNILYPSVNSFVILLSSSSIRMRNNDVVRVSCRDVATDTDIPLRGENVDQQWGSLSGRQYDGDFYAGSTYRVRLTYISDVSTTHPQPQPITIPEIFTPVKTMGTFEVTYVSPSLFSYGFTVNLNDDDIGMEYDDMVEVSCVNNTGGAIVTLTGTNPIKWSDLHNYTYTGEFIPANSYSVIITSTPIIPHEIAFPNSIDTSFVSTIVS